ncbi:MAG: hypothetical protein ACFFBP_17300 [Promethearchaeota archaeon]
MDLVWNIVANIYNVTFSLYFFIIAGLMFLISKRGFKSNNRYGGGSTIVCGIIFIIFGVFNLILPRENGSYFGLLPYPFNGFMVWWIGIILLVNYLFALIMRRNIKKVDNIKINGLPLDGGIVKLKPLQKYVVFIKNESPYKEQISIKMEAIRKAFHLCCILILLAYYGFFFLAPLTSLVNDSIIIFIKQVEWSYNLLWGSVSDYPYVPLDPQAVIDLTFFALIAALIFTITSELIRVLWGPEYSLFNVVTRAILRNKEYNAIGPQIYLLAGVIFSYLLFIMGLVLDSVVMASIVIACISDALAALIGRKYGTHKIKCINGDIKSLEGFIAGSGSAFIIGLMFLGPIYGLITGLIFFLLDYFPLSIADNLLNPIMITVGVMLVSLLLPGLTIGW